MSSLHKQLLPVFSFHDYIQDLHSSTRQQQLNDNRNKWQAMWITPGSRPLAEPMTVDWDWFRRNVMPSDVRYERLFPFDPEKRARSKDVDGERMALHEYRTWTHIMSSDDDVDEARRDFYQELSKELDNDWEEVESESYQLWTQASELGQFEYKYLDSDGKTERISRLLGNGVDILEGWNEDVQERYGHLRPVDFESNALATWEQDWLNDNGTTQTIENKLRAGENILEGRGEEVLKKYGHLAALLLMVTAHNVVSDVE